MHFRFGNALSQFVLHIHTDYTKKESLGRKGVGTAFLRVPTEKSTLLANVFIGLFYGIQMTLRDAFLPD